MITLSCTYCNKDFLTKKNQNSPRKFCSQECSIQSKKSKVNLYSCVQCKKITKNTKFCSRSCSASFNNTGRRRWSKPDSRNSRVKLCKACGRETHRPVYCSDQCNPRRLSNLTKNEKHQRSRSMHNEAWARYMAKKKNQTPENADINAIQQFYINCPEGYEVDHIIPISKGGLHTLDNLQYLTISENRKKSNKIL